MKTWKETKLDLGEVENNKKIKVSFKLLDKTVKIKDIKTTCGCTKAKYDKEEQIVSVNYVASKPHHLLNSPVYITKSVYVQYDKDGNIKEDVLTFDLKIV